MFDVPNPVTWLTFFDKYLIQDCNVKIYSSTNDLLLDKSNFSSFSGTSRNSYVCESLPTDNFTIQIVGWSSLASVTQAYLTTRGNVVRIGYVVENTETTEKKTLCIDSCKVDRKGWGATLTLVSPFNFYTETTPNLNSNVTLSLGVEGAFPYNATMAEIIQQRAIYTCQGVSVSKSSVNLTNYPFTLTTFSTTPLTYGTLSSYNIKDYSYYEVEDKSSITYYGIESGTDSAIFTKSGTTIYSAGEEIATATKQMGQLYHYTSLTLTVGGTAKILTTKIITSQGFNAEYRGSASSSHSFTFTLTGFLATLEELPQNLNYYIQTPTLISGSTRMGTAQTRAREYYGYCNCIELDCRLDPRFEPLDIIAVSGLSKVVAIEEVQINFNGGFTGKIKGRLIE